MERWDVIAVGASWGGLNALGELLESFPADVTAPVVIAQHRSIEATPGGLERLLQLHTARPLRQASDKEPLRRGHVYVAPPDYHLLVEGDALALSTEARVQHARPSIDVLFESVADEYGPRAVGIVLTGANADGAEGLARIKERGGVALVQQPESAERRAMPDAALAATAVDAVLPLRELGPFLSELARSREARA